MIRRTKGATRHPTLTGVVGADGQISDDELILGTDGGRVLVLGGLEPPGHGGRVGGDGGRVAIKTEPVSV